MSASNKRFKKNKNRTNKVNLVFDVEKRRDFLTGFHKRKEQRKKKAQEKLENLLKEEKRRLKNETKQCYKKLITSHKLIPEIQEFIQEEIDNNDVTVQITQLSTNSLIHEHEQVDAATYMNEGLDKSEEIPGMCLKKPKCKLDILPNIQFSSEKQIKKTLRKTATKYIQNSTVFQKKNKIEKQKQKKRSLQKRRENLKEKNFRERHKKNKH